MNDLFLRVCRGEAVPRPPVWMMRQAGRYLAEYRELRSRYDFLTLCKTPELAAEVTVQPIRRFGMDAAILFADILLPLEAMGAELQFVKGDGPRFPDPVRRRQDLDRLRRPRVEATLGYVFEALRRVRRDLGGQTPVLGFAGTPWTLAAYLVEGGISKHHQHLLSWSYSDEAGMRELLDRIADVSIEYLQGQIDAGAQALQLFDTWGGLLDAQRWRRIALPSVLKILEGIGAQVPVIFYLRGGAHLLPVLARLPVTGLSVDWRQPIDEVREIVGPDLVLQGNLDPAALLATPEEIRARTQDLVSRGRTSEGYRRHIVNLGHGILPMTPVDNARAFIETVQQSAEVPA